MNAPAPLARVIVSSARGSSDLLTVISYLSSFIRTEPMFFTGRTAGTLNHITEMSIQRTSMFQQIHFPSERIICDNHILCVIGAANTYVTVLYVSCVALKQVIQREGGNEALSITSS